MSTNDFLPFCPTDTGTNLESQANYIIDPNRVSGNKPGVASSILNNKALRQGTYITSQLAQFISDSLGEDVLDNNVPAQILGQMNAQFFKRSPIFSKFTSGGGTFAKTYSFKIASGNATVGATYTNNTSTFTVKATVSASAFVDMTSDSGAPTSNGTLTKTSGTGDTTLTFYAVQSALYLRVRAVAGGGGGIGSGTSVGSGAGTGGNTTFGSSLITCVGGTGGSVSGSFGVGGAGGGGTIGSGAVGVAFTSQTGGYSQYATGTSTYIFGGAGGSTAFGGGGIQTFNGSGGAGSANTGGGGAGGSIGGVANGVSGAGGGGGGFIDAIVQNPSATYSYFVGALGAASSAGTSGQNGGDGAAGIILVEEFFQ